MKYKALLLLFIGAIGLFIAPNWTHAANPIVDVLSVEIKEDGGKQYLYIRWKLKSITDLNLNEGFFNLVSLFPAINGNTYSGSVVSTFGANALSKDLDGSSSRYPWSTWDNGGCGYPYVPLRTEYVPETVYENRFTKMYDKSRDQVIDVANIKEGDTLWINIFSSYGSPQGNNCSYAEDTAIFEDPESYPIHLQPIQKTPILFVPGILGTEIKKGDELLWAAAKMGNPFNDDSFMDPLQFFPDLIPSDSTVVHAGVIRNITIDTTIAQFKIYDYADGLIKLLTSPEIGYVENVNFFTLPYDWRFGINEDNVNQLRNKIESILAQTGSDKINIIAHSTGGLLVKKYVIDNSADRHINKAVFIGMPNLGAPKAWKALISGDNFSVLGLNSQEMKKISQNLPVAYDLAPDREYVNQIGGFLKIRNLSNGTLTNTNYDQAIQEFESDNLLNSQALTKSQNLHTTFFDNFDLRTAGIEPYNIIGCKTATFGEFIKTIYPSYLPFNDTYDFPKNVSGDGTVPLGSAQSIPADPDHIFFAPKANHGTMPSADGIRQKIVNILTESNLDTGNVLTREVVQQNPKKCQLSGEAIKIKSPVTIEVTDQFNNRSGIAEDGSIENSIPGADYEIWGEHKYVFLPTGDGEQYTINLKGTGNGTFTLQNETIDNDQTVQTQVFSDIPTSTDLKGQLSISDQSTLLLDTNGDNVVDEALQPSSIINADQSADIIPPATTAVATGTQGESGFYRSDVSIELSAIDPIITGHEAETSGILKTRYSLDGNNYQDYVSPIVLSNEGNYTISFFSTDFAGNNEEVKTLTLTIDKTAPEFLIQFDPTSKDLKFSGTDNISSQVSISDLDNSITASDQAGNQTVMQLKDRSRKQLMRGEIKSLSYNGQSQDMSRNILFFVWQKDRQGNLVSLLQNITAKSQFTISALYSRGKTLLIGRDANGRILKTQNGLVLLKVMTNKGDLKWSH